MKHARSASSAVNLIATLLATTALVIPPSFAGEILPQNGSVVSGNVTVQSSDGAMTVTQGSDKAIVNWQSFSVGQNNSVTFVQPGSSSVILNRVTGAATSTLAGAIHANGQVYLINPNGIAITPTGTVNVGGGFVASTLDMSDEDFLSGKALFEGDGSSASVTNDGVITIGRGGYAALMGGTVKNNGLISVPLGKVGLGSGEQITLDLSGDGFMQVALPTKDGAEGDGALIENSGTVSANGGTAVMKAATAREAARKAVNLSGVVEAKSVSGRNGAIVIGGGRGGSVKIAGKVKSRSSTGKGGSIKVSAARIDLVGAEIDASGATGGGTVLIGGKKYGADGMQTAARTSVDANTIIRADATQDGNGGQVVVWSDELTTFAGTITARGMRNGDGGDAEVSGKQTLAYTGLVDLSAESGSFGTLLLDPYNLTITSDIGAGTSLAANGDDSTLSVATLVTALSTANVTVSTGSGGTQNGDITVADNVTWGENTVLTLDAANDIIFNADVTATGEDAGLALKYGGDYTFNSGASLTLSGANASLSMNDQAYTLIHSMSELDAIDSTGLNGHYALAQDLDASGTTYTEAVVGVDTSHTFGGEFTGLGNTISNLTIEAPSNNHVALFGVNTGTIRDIRIENGSVTGYQQSGLLAGYNGGGAKVLNSAVTGTLNVYSYSGGLVGYSAGAIDSSSSSVTVTGSGTGSFTGNYIGGLVGAASSGSTIKNSQATGDVTGVRNVGGLVGSNYGMISLSHATGTVTGTSYIVGGLVGHNVSVGSIISSYATGKVTGTDKVGGLVGRDSGAITSSYAAGDVNGQDEVGGLVGYSDNGDAAQISKSYATGDVSGMHYVGGLVGLNKSNITQSYATGAVDAVGAIGGLIGENIGTVSHTYAIGPVSGTFSIGGLIGINYADVSNSYAAGLVSGLESKIGGLVGFNQITGTVTQSYWNITKTGQTTGIDLDSNSSSTDVSGLTDAEMRDSASMSAWDFGNDWFLIKDETLPFLRSEYSTTITNTHQLQMMASDLSASYTLAYDIDASDANTSIMWNDNGFVPIGDFSDAFSGQFDGQDNKISGLTISRGDDYNVGLFGHNSGTITNVGLVDGSVVGTGSVGGLAGANSGSISSSYSSLTISASAESHFAEYFGGLVGLNSGSISKSYATGSVSGRLGVGGLVGRNSAGTISQSYAAGTVNATADIAGGLVGFNNGVIANSYATGSVTASNLAGGLSGNNVRDEDDLEGTSSGIIRSSYASGTVSGAEYAAGLVGYNANKVISSFWDVETTGQTEGIRLAHANASTDATGLTSEDMKDPFSFIDAGWDFETVWGQSTNSTGNIYLRLGSSSEELYGGYVKLKNASMVHGGDTPDASDLFTSDSIGTDNAKVVWSDTLSTADVGDYAYRDVLTLSGVDGKKVYLAATGGTLTITPAPRTVNQTVNEPVTVPTAGMFFNNPSVGTASLDTPSVRLSAPSKVHQNQGGGDIETDGSDNSDGSQTSPFANVVVSEFSDGSDGSQPQEAIVTEDPQLSGTLCFAGSNFATYCASN
jgi:filamentous hemagglutinin family protein